MIKLQAPYPSLQTTTLLPNPDFGDGENLTHEVSMRRALDGSLYTYVKRKTHKHIQWTFSLTRNKALELRAFVQSYYASMIRVTDHTGRIWCGYLVNNPFEFETNRRAAPAISPMPRGERQQITIEFEGVEQ